MELGPRPEGTPETTSAITRQTHSWRVFLCFKRYVATQKPGLHEDFDKDPRDSEEAKRLIEVYKMLARNDFSHYQRDRIEETFNIQGKVVNENILCWWRNQTIL